jgi:AcrR family transcriptional regulator
MPGPVATRGPRLSRAARETLMVEAAERIFSERGFNATSMDDIAAASGVTKALVYQYFGSKEALWDVCVETARARLFGGIERALADVPIERQLRAFAERYFDYLDENRGAWWMFYGGASPEAALAMRERNAEVIARMLARALDRAGRRDDPEAMDVLAHGLVGAGEQIGRWWIARPNVPKGRAIERFLSVAQGAITGSFRELPPR